MPRVVTLVLLRADGSLVGEMAPFPVSTPWWQEVENVVAAAAEHGADVTVLRLVHTEPDLAEPSQMGGAVTYTAELHGEAPTDIHPVDEVATVDAVLDDHELRLPWARPGGPALELAWAERVLADHGREPTDRPRQMRTWNLSSIWMIPTSAGPVWLKSVPPFFAHEGRIIEWIGESDLPPLLGSEAGRVLMDDIPGDDQYDAPVAILQRAVETLVAIQHRASGRVDELRALGLPDWRWDALRPLIDDVVDRHARELDRSERSALTRLTNAFETRCADIDACGLPMSLVHGDFHPGNLRGDDDHLFLLDWGDCGVGHPLFDVPAMVERLDREARAALWSTWEQQWRERCPDSDPVTAATLIEPIAALRQAVIYRCFLDGIEPSERVFHSADPARWLRRAAEAQNNQA